jgi:hypothetical protein
VYGLVHSGGCAAVHLGESIVEDALALSRERIRGQNYFLE